LPVKLSEPPATVTTLLDPVAVIDLEPGMIATRAARTGRSIPAGPCCAPAADAV
jgi:hypothetical protein